MSDLQASLLIIGVVVVGGVTAFNWFQQWRLRRRLEQAFDGKHEDALLRERAPAAAPARAAPQGRVEPQLGSVRTDSAVDAPAERGSSFDSPTPTLRTSGAADAAASLPPVPDFDPEIDFILTIDAAEPISPAGLAELHTKAATSGKRFRVYGFNMQAQDWEEAARLSGGRYSHLRLALQLVSRRGAVDLGALTAFCAAGEDCAERANGQVSYSSIEASLHRARELDAFCAEVDVAIGVNVVAPEGVKFNGTRIRAAAESAGFKLEPQGVFLFQDDAQRTLFALDNHEPAPFLPEQVKHMTTSGITLLLDVPRVADGVGTLEVMLRIGRELARALGGTLVDDNRKPLTDASVRAIQQQLQSIRSNMETRGMAPGSERALRLFS